MEGAIKSTHGGDFDRVEISIHVDMLQLCPWKCQKNFLFLKKLKKCAAEQKPHNWIKWTVLIICLVIVYHQLVECLRKLRNPPITSHSKLTMNDTMYYPALTVCREPPYNLKVYPKFNFSTEHVGSYPYTSLWKYFPYHQYNISDFWRDAVYNESVFSSYGLNQKGKDVELTSSIHMQRGMCHTIRPKRPVEELGRKSGYSLFLNHDLYDYRPLLDEEPGWKIYIHEPREKFSENINLMSSRQDHVFVAVGEETEISIDPYQFNILRNCTNAENYSVTECEENCSIERDVKPYVGCSGPFLSRLEKPYCNDSDGMRDLVKATVAMKNNNCCIKNCKTTHYKVFVVKRTSCPPERKLSSTAMIYFSSKTVITMEERFSYCWGDFLGEIGGSVGFLLGLSIVGIIDVLDKSVRFFFCQKEEKRKRSEVGNDSTISRSPTVEVIPSSTDKY